MNSEKLIIITGIDKVGKTSYSGILRGLKLACTEIDLFNEEILALIDSARSEGKYISLRYISLPSAEECIERFKRDLSDQEQEEVRMRFSRQYERLDQLLPLCDEVQIYDNYNGFDLKKEYKKHLVL